MECAHADDAVCTGHGFPSGELVVGQHWEPLAPLTALLSTPAVRFSARQQALVQMRQEMEARDAPAPEPTRRRRQP